jgi:thiamine biosynthesis lipoprotein
MKETRLLMGMPITIEIVDGRKVKEAIEKVFEYFKYIDEKFSPFKPTSEISKINNKEIPESNWSDDVKQVFQLAGETKKETDGYFDILDNSGKYNPSGIVKGWAIYNASNLLKEMGFHNYYIDAGGDIQVCGRSSEKKSWKIGIRNPLKPNEYEVIKIVYLGNNEGIATSGTYIRGQHIYNPKNRKEEINEIVSISIVGPNIYEADRFATAAFAMQRQGINFIEKLNGFEGYMIDKSGIATMTTNFEKYTNT